MKLLIVDDVDANLKVLRVTFEAEGHTIIEARDGIEALQVLERESIDAMLSDIMMPRMDGYRLCHEIRTNELLRHLPHLPIVIYTSTYTSSGDEKLALRLGADRYLKKPAPFQTILGVLQEAIAMPHASRRPEAWQEVEALKEYGDTLVAKLEKRNIELAEANARLFILDRAKNEFLIIIAHELRTPLNGLFILGDLVIAGMLPTRENLEIQDLFVRSRNRILSILEDALLLTRIDVQTEEFGGASVALGYILSHAIQDTTEFARSRDVAFAMLAENLGPVLGDQELLIRSFRSLLETAVKFSRKGETVELTQEVVGDSMKVIIDSHSWSITSTAMPKFFEVFSIEEALTPGGDLGLGPAVASRILSLFGASVSVANRDPLGIRLTVSLKSAMPNSSRQPALADA